MKLYVLILMDYYDNNNEIIGIFDSEEKATDACIAYMSRCNGVWNASEFEIEEKEMNEF